METLTNKKTTGWKRLKLGLVRTGVKAGVVMRKAKDWRN
jgi:hypothetical protein